MGSDPTRPEALPYVPGTRLGDLVLAGQQNVGQGSVVVLGDATGLCNDGIPFSYTFLGPLLASLSEKATTPLLWWRQLLALVSAAIAIGLLFHRFQPLRLAAAALVLALALVACDRVNDTTRQLLPASVRSTAFSQNPDETPRKGGTTSARPLIYVDGSHLEAMGKDPWRDDGIGRFMRMLADSGYLPLVAPDLGATRLDAAKMLVSVAPGRKFNASENAAVTDFVERGGNFLCMTGSPDAEPSRPLLDELKLNIEPIPLPPWKNLRETEPLGAMSRSFDGPSGQSQTVKFFAAWPVSGEPGGNRWPPNDLARKPVIAGNRVREGQAFLLGDSQFALHKAFVPPSDPTAETTPQNALFWETTLRAWLGPPGN